jgi:hypothetical protein
MSFRPTHRDENRVELCVYADGAWNAKICFHLDEVMPFSNLIRNARFETNLCRNTPRVAGW